jgi:hypothetical protein
MEIDLGIACACAPALKPLFLRWFPNILDSVFGRSSRTTRQALAGNTGTFALVDSPNTTSRGKTSQTENILPIYGKSESQERIYNHSTIDPEPTSQLEFSGRYKGHDDRGRRDAGFTVTRIEAFGAKLESARRN